MSYRAMYLENIIKEQSKIFIIIKMKTLK